MDVPTTDPTTMPTSDPTAMPSSDPTAIPSSDPTALPTFDTYADISSVVPDAVSSSEPTNNPLIPSLISKELMVPVTVSCICFCFLHVIVYFIVKYRKRYGNEVLRLAKDTEMNKPKVMECAKVHGIDHKPMKLLQRQQECISTAHHDGENRKREGSTLAVNDKNDHESVRKTKGESLETNRNDNYNITDDEFIVNGDDETLN